MKRLLVQCNVLTTPKCGTVLIPDCLQLKQHNEALHFNINYI